MMFNDNQGYTTMLVIQTSVDEETYYKLKEFAANELTSLAQINRLILVKLASNPKLLDDIYKKGRALAIQKAGRPGQT